MISTNFLFWFPLFRDILAAVDLSLRDGDPFWPILLGGFVLVIDGPLELQRQANHGVKSKQKLDSVRFPM